MRNMEFLVFLGLGTIPTPTPREHTHGISPKTRNTRITKVFLKIPGLGCPKTIKYLEYKVVLVFPLLFCPQTTKYNVFLVLLFLFDPYTKNSLINSRKTTVNQILAKHIMCSLTAKVCCSRTLRIRRHRAAVERAII